MRVPLSWLREFVDIDLSPEQLAERLTLLGMEVKTIERWGADWEQVVTGELVTVEKHPRADRLSLTTVTFGDGAEPLSIVCGATNIAPGQRIPVALPGAVLPGNRRIERAEKMGVVSHGMLCSEAELGIGESRPFEYRGNASFVNLGRYKAVGKVGGRTFRGFPAWWMARTYHMSQIPGAARKARAVIDWTASLPFRRDISEVGSIGHPKPLEATIGTWDSSTPSSPSPSA